jgi:hypothetical protein
VREVVEGPPCQPQEAVAARVCERLLALDAHVAGVGVYIRKPHVALPGVLESVGACACAYASSQCVRVRVRERVSERVRAALRLSARARHQGVQ